MSSLTKRVSIVLAALLLSVLVLLSIPTSLLGGVVTDSQVHNATYNRANNSGNRTGCDRPGELFHCSRFPPGIVLSTYLVSLKDPQRKIGYSSEGKYSLIAGFFSSIHHFDMQAYIFHDGLHQSFINRYQTSNFVFFDVRGLATEGEGIDIASYVSNNDRRFLYYHLFLRRIEAQTPAEARPSFVLTCDLFDVKFANDPFKFLREHDSQLVIGSEPKRIHNNGFMKNRIKCCRFNKLQSKILKSGNKLMLNAGLIGGSWPVFKRFLSLLSAQFPLFNPRENCNMALINYVAYTNFSRRVVTGYPFHSLFRARQSGVTDVYVIHKR
eukprot:gb/GECG01016442.1/.p1 GENE.gb/GECG01016442.1/~~gb/GECG01016442.1/.p1  ORF type:complete len:325 (+),score=9.85 gb/GECG01016442.1/:1-975(+)